MTAVSRPGTAMITATDRLGLTLFFSVVLHGIVILGIVFSANEPAKNQMSPTLEIILNDSSSQKKVEDADYLAQTNQDASGNVTERVRPTTPRTAPQAASMPGQSDLFTPPQQATPPQNPHSLEVLTADQSAVTTPELTEERTLPEATTTTAAELMRRSKEIAKLSAEFDESREAYTRMPKQRYISARSQSFRDAAYLEAWRQKIEKVGNLNYPEEAKRQHLSGSLILDVALNADGTVHNIELRHSSGYKLLDDAAIRIVRLAAPFAPFSPEMRTDTDILHITRTWQFLNDNSFASGM